MQGACIVCGITYYKFPIGGPTNEFEFFMSVRYSGLLNGKVDNICMVFQ